MRWEPWVAWSALAGMLAAGAVSDAWGRMHAPYRGHRIVPVASAPLDGFTTPAAAYSFRKLRTAYAGFAVRLRRVDTTTQDIGFTGTGDFDTATAAAFCTTACTVQTWFDQSGNGRNVSQATPANQPAYVANCIGTLPCLRASGTAQNLAGLTVTPATGVMTQSIVARADTVAATCVGLQVDGASWGPWSGGPNWLAFYGSSAFPAATVGAWHTGLVLFNGASSTTRIDSTEAAATFSAPASTAGSLIAGGGGAAGACSQTEAIWWDNYQLTGPERTAIADNQRNYWIPQVVGIANPAAAYSFRKIVSLYNGPAVQLRRVDTTTANIGFTPGGDFDSAAAAAFCTTACTVQTWYDQSGLGRNTTNVAGSQPSYVANCIGSKPCALSDVAGKALNGPSVTPAAGPASFSAVMKAASGPSALCLGMNAGAMQIAINDVNWILWNGSGALFNLVAPSVGAWHVGNGVINNAASVINVDGTEATGSLAPATTAGVVDISHAFAAVPCSFTESVWWDNYALTPAERIALVNNQRDYWTPLPLDTATPSGAYSFRKLKSAYAGPALKLRRATGGTLDINFLGGTGFTGAPWDVAAATAFCAATTCFLDTWYDQSGLARHLVQATPANQPQLSFACKDGKPCFRATTTQLAATAATYAWTSPVSLSAVSNLSQTDGGVVECRWIMAGSNNLQTFAAPFYLLATGNIGTSVPAVNAWHTQQGVINGAASVYNVDGAETTGTVTAIATAATIQAGYAGPAGSTCDLAEAIAWSGYALTPAERTFLTNNQRAWITP